MRLSLGRRARLVLLACLALAAAATGASIAAREAQEPDVNTLTQQLDSLAREKDSVQQKLRGVKRREQQVSRELASIDAKLDRAETRLLQVSGDVTQAQADAEQAAYECQAAETRLAGHCEDLSARLVAIYQRGEVKPIEVLVQATSFTDFANRLYLLNEVVDHDAELLGQYEEASKEAEARRAELRAREERLVGLKDLIAEEKRRTRAERQDTQRKKQDLLRDRAAWERALSELEENSRQVEAMLQRLQRSPEGETRLAKPWTGKLDWPLRGRIASGFGYRDHPIYHVRKMHTGVDIPASSGTQIRAAGAGTVVHAARWGGYGNCVIIDHGGGLATLYAHCSRLAVSNGATVKQGDVIAYVGSTGLSTGPHLHFEVRRSGRPVDPISFLP